MGFFDYVSDLYSSLAVQTAEAEEPVNAGPKDTSGEQTSGRDARAGGIGSAQHDRGAQVRGGASAKPSPAAGAAESADEAEANQKDAQGAQARMAANSQAGASGRASAGDTNASGSAGDDEEQEAEGEDGGEDEEEGGDDEEEEEEEEEEEPEDIKPKLEEDCLKTQQCAPLKHHYDECVERVTHQQEENGKAEEDCVEEYFHMMHCATQCAAPKLFRQLR